MHLNWSLCHFLLLCSAAPSAEKTSPDSTGSVIAQALTYSASMSALHALTWAMASMPQSCSTWSPGISRPSSSRASRLRASASTSPDNMRDGVSIIRSGSGPSLPFWMAGAAPLTSVSVRSPDSDSNSEDRLNLLSASCCICERLMIPHRRLPRRRQFQGSRQHQDDST